MARPVIRWTGAGYVPHNERVWRTIRGKSPDLMLLLGDNIYSDDPETAARTPAAMAKPGANVGSISFTRSNWSIAEVNASLVVDE